MIGVACVRDSIGKGRKRREERGEKARANILMLQNSRKAKVHRPSEESTITKSRRLTDQPLER